MVGGVDLLFQKCLPGKRHNTDTHTRLINPENKCNPDVNRQ